MFEGLRIANDGLMQQFLQSTAVVQTLAYLRHKFVRNVKNNAAALAPNVKHMAGVLLTRKAGGAVLAHTGVMPKSERTKTSGPQTSGLLTEPAPDVPGRFSFV